MYGSYEADVFINNRDRLLYKDHLLQLFTVASRPMLSIPTNLIGTELILLTVDYPQELTEIVSAGRIFSVPKQALMTLSLSESDTEVYKDSKKSITLVDTDSGKYKIGDRYITSWGKQYSVSMVKKYRHITKYSKYTELSPTDIKRVGDSNVYIFTLELLGDSHVAYIPPSDSNAVYGIAKIVSDREMLLYKLQDDGSKAPYHIHDKLNIVKGYIENYIGSSMMTTYGLYLINYTILVLPFGDKIGYINSADGKSDFNLGKLDNKVAELLLDGVIGRPEYDKYMQYGYFIGHMAQLGVVGLTKKALTTDPRIAIRKKELLEIHKHELHDPTVITKIEAELIEMDKAWLRGDPSYDRYYATNEDKSFNELRKKMFVTMGIAPAFSKDTNKYEFTETSLVAGTRPKDMVNMSNEIRRGTYDRGIGTAKGGEQTKFILRVFNATVIAEDNCGSKKGLTVHLTEANKSLFINRSVLDPVSGKVTLLTKDGIDKYVGKVVQIRSPMYCKTKNGLCYTCVGDTFRKLDRESIGMLAVFIGSKFTSINMKSMHFSGIKSGKISDFTKYFVI